MMGNAGVKTSSGWNSLFAALKRCAIQGMCENDSSGPSGLARFHLSTHGLRRGVQSIASSELCRAIKWSALPVLCLVTVFCSAQDQTPSQAVPEMKQVPPGHQNMPNLPNG